MILVIYQAVHASPQAIHLSLISYFFGFLSRGSGSASSTLSFSMAVSHTTFSGLRTEMGILETNQYLHSQLEKSKQDFRDLTEKLLTSQAAVYSLAKQLQKHSKSLGSQSP